MPKKSKRGYARKRVIKTLEGKEISIHISPKDWEHFKVPKTNLEHVRPQFFEYLGVLVGRASHTKTNGYLIRRLAPKYSDLEGKYLKLHKKLFGREPDLHVKPDGSHDIRVNSKATYEYLIDAWGFNPKAKTKNNILAESVIEHLFDNRKDRQAFLKGFFSGHLKPRYNSQQPLNFFFFFNHQNPKVSDFVADLAKKEGIRITGKDHRRFISSKKSKLKTIDLLGNPYEQARLIVITAEKKGFGEKQSPKKVAARIKKADLKNIDPELRQTGILEKAEKHLKKGLFGKMTPAEKKAFRTKIKGADISAGLKLKQIERERIKKQEPSPSEKKRAVHQRKKRAEDLRSLGLTQEEIGKTLGVSRQTISIDLGITQSRKSEKSKKPKILPYSSKRMILSKGKLIDPEHQVKIIQAFLNNKNHKIVDTHIKRIDTDKKVIAKIEKYARTYHPNKTRVIQAFKKYRESS
ncbi:hypothetical protein K8R43_05780 [archaeon]|nr:hypothetical protein [archaeon]